ncbi:hypothetical protein TNCV_3633331 [Trichonephila clavipes]|nr:hypothetical protein TNCV_3633331 [Trichonephila clavipes]
MCRKSINEAPPGVSNTGASERRRRIPFDYQKTSLAGLALDSATSSGLGRAPPLCNAGPHPGTTWSYKTGGIIHQLIEQPGHAG